MLQKLLLSVYLFTSSTSPGANRKYILLSILFMEFALIALSAIIGYPGYVNFAGMRPPVFELWNTMIDSAWIFAVAVPTVISIFLSTLLVVAVAGWILKSGKYSKGSVQIKGRGGSMTTQTNKEYLTNLTNISRGEIFGLLAVVLLAIPMDTARNVVGAAQISTDKSNTTMVDSDDVRKGLAGASIDVDRFAADVERYTEKMDRLSAPYKRTDQKGDKYILWECEYRDSQGRTRKHWSDCNAVAEAHAEYITASAMLTAAESNYNNAVSLLQSMDKTTFGLGEAAKSLNNNFLLGVIICIYLAMPFVAIVSAFVTIRLKLEDPEHLRSGKSTMLSNILGAFVERMGNFSAHTRRSVGEAKANFQSAKSTGPKSASSKPFGGPKPTPSGGGNPFSSPFPSSVTDALGDPDDDDDLNIRSMPNLVKLYQEYYRVSKSGRNPISSKRQTTASGFAGWLRAQNQGGPRKTVQKPGVWEKLMAAPGVRELP